MLSTSSTLSVHKRMSASSLMSSANQILQKNPWNIQSIWILEFKPEIQNRIFPSRCPPSSSRGRRAAGGSRSSRRPPARTRGRGYPSRCPASPSCCPRATGGKRSSRRQSSRTRRAGGRLAALPPTTAPLLHSSLLRCFLAVCRRSVEEGGHWRPGRGRTWSSPSSAASISLPAEVNKVQFHWARFNFTAELKFKLNKLCLNCAYWLRVQRRKHYWYTPCTNLVQLWVRVQKRKQYWLHLQMNEVMKV